MIFKYSSCSERQKQQQQQTNNMQMYMCWGGTLPGTWFHYVGHCLDGTTCTYVAIRQPPEHVAGTTVTLVCSERFRVHHCFIGIVNPGGWILRSWTKSQLTTEAKLQSPRHWELMSTGSTSDHRGVHDVSWCWHGWRRSLLSGHAWCTVALATSSSTAGLCFQADGSIWLKGVLQRTFFYFN